MSTYDPEGWTRKDILVVAKAYPRLSKKYIETVCTGGITAEGEWIRLYPIWFRYLPVNSMYKKYQWISIRVKKSETDKRPETYRPDLKSIQLREVISPDDNWKNRREIVLPLTDESIEDLRARNRETGVSMGLVKVRELLDFKMEKLDIPLRYKQVQLSLFEEIKDLDPIPYVFKYRFKCMGEKCQGHRMSILDWEIGRLYARACQSGVADEDLYKYIAHNFVDVIFASNREVYFYLGTHRGHPYSFMIGGVLYYKKEGSENERELSLFVQ